MGLKVSGLIHDAVAVDVSAQDQAMRPGGTRGVYIGVAGNLEVTMEGGTKITFANVPVGFHPLQVTIIHNANTTATNIRALY